MIICQFIFAPGEYDEDFHVLDDQIDAYARSLPGFRATETWHSSDGKVVNATYYFDDMASVRQLSSFPQHVEAKGQYQRWYWPLASTCCGKLESWRTDAMSSK